MIRFSHTLFALPFALAGAVLAWRAAGRTQPFDLLIDVAGLIPFMVFARSTAMAVMRDGVAPIAAGEAPSLAETLAALPSSPQERWLVAALLALR